MSNAQRTFWQMVNDGAFASVNESICRDALRDTPNISIEEFLDEAIDYGWVTLSDGIDQ